jgi:hypothetical protein
VKIKNRMAAAKRQKRWGFGNKNDFIAMGIE